MKKIMISLAMAVLCLFLGDPLYSQTTALKIGENVPDVTINNIFNYKTTSTRLSDFKGKLLILDFWATWCGPCVEMIPKMDSLQKQFADKVQFLSITYQTEKDAISFIKRLEQQQNFHSVLPIITDDIELKKLFPHRALPHYVWIMDGKLNSITGYDAITEENIKKILNHGQLATVTKIDSVLNYDYNKPLFLDPRNAKLVHTQSVLTGYIEGLKSASSYNVNSKNPSVRKKITATNLSMVRLYQVAMSKGTGKYTWDKTILAVRDTAKVRNRSSGARYKEWLSNGNGYCYELILPEATSDPFSIMEQDLRRYFLDYTVTIERIESEVLVLTRTSDIDLIKTKGSSPSYKIDATGCLLSNQKLSVLNRYIDTYLKPVVDETGYGGSVDILLYADMNNISAINKELSKYHLQYIPAKKEIEFLVVRDKN